MKLLCRQGAQGVEQAVDPGSDGVTTEVKTPLPLAVQSRRPKALVIDQLARKLGRDLEILRVEQHAGAAECLRDGRRGVGENRHVHRHGFDKRRAESLVLAERDVQMRVAIVRRELDIWHRPREPEALGEHLELLHHRPDRSPVPRNGIVTPDENETIVRVHVAFEVFGQLDVVFDFLVRREPADEENVRQTVTEQSVQRRARRGVCQPRGVHEERHDHRLAEPEVVELLAVVLRHAKRQIHAVDERRQFLASEPGETRDRRIERREIVRRRDVVVADGTGAGERAKRGGHRRRNREVQNGGIPIARGRIRPRPHIVPQVVVDAQRVDL